MMYNSIGCEYILQNDKFISVIFMYYINFAIFDCFKLKKKTKLNPSENHEKI